jgi:hypothetical protein
VENAGTEGTRGRGNREQGTSDQGLDVASLCEPWSPNAKDRGHPASLPIRTRCESGRAMKRCAGAKARFHFALLAARVNSCPDTRLVDLGSCSPSSPNARDHHPTDLDLPVGAPDQGHPTRAKRLKSAAVMLRYGSRG